MSYYNNLAGNEIFFGNYTQSIEYCKEALKIDSSYITLFILGWNYYRTNRYNESLKYMKSSLEKVQEDLVDQIFFHNNSHRVAYAYWKNGYLEEAEHYFDLQLEYLLSSIEMKRPLAQSYNAYYDLAAVYAFRGDKEKALENLRIFNQRKIFPYWMAELIKRDELFDSMRDEPEFQQIVRDVEAKYQAEHERVRKWLEENNML
jgi:tetratricopeptide (TPR) repeat protein